MTISTEIFRTLHYLAYHLQFILIVFIYVTHLRCVLKKCNSYTLNLKLKIEIGAGIIALAGENTSAILVCFVGHMKVYYFTVMSRC